MSETPAEKQRDLHPSEIAKNEAEAEATRLKAQAEVEKLRAEARKADAEAKVAELEAETDALRMVEVEFAADRAREKRQEELAAHKYHHVYLFDKGVDETSVKACIAQMTSWERTTTEPLTIELVIDSPGGSVFDGFHLIDYINRLHENGHTVNTTAYGMAASMAGVLLQVGKTRAMGANSLLLIHEASFSAGGQFGKVEDQVKMVELMHDRILELFAERSKMTKATIARRWRRRDWWISAQESLRHGFVDEVR